MASRMIGCAHACGFGAVVSGYHSIFPKFSYIPDVQRVIIRERENVSHSLTLHHPKFCGIF